MQDGENIRKTETLNIDMIGFIFYPKSPRYIYEMPDYMPVHARRVGVFVNEPRHRNVRRSFRIELHPTSRT